MRTYWDLEEKERAALTSEDVEKYLAAELMSKGVLQVQPLQLVEVVPVEPPASTFFEVRRSSYDSMRVLFRTAEQAKQFLQLEPLMLDHVWLGSETVCFVDDRASLPEIVALNYRSRAEHEALKERLTKASAGEVENRRRSDEHAKAVKAQDDALKGLWDDWYACQARAARMKRIRDTFDEYKRIAEDSRVAARFLRKAFRDDDIHEAAVWFDDYSLTAIEDVSVAAEEAVA